MARTVYHVLPQGDEWAVKKEGADRASSLHPRKEDAVASGQVLAKGSQPSQLVIHLANGRIETEYTYGDDPYPPPG